MNFRPGWVWPGRIVVSRIILRWWLRLPQEPHKLRLCVRKGERKGGRRRRWTRRWSCLLRDGAGDPVRQVWEALWEIWARWWCWFCRRASWMASDAGRGDSSWVADAFSAMPARSWKVPTQHYRHSVLAGISMADERAREKRGQGTANVNCEGMRVVVPGKQHSAKSCPSLCSSEW